jgi:hypothetical protein
MPTIANAKQRETFPGGGMVLVRRNATKNKCMPNFPAYPFDCAGTHYWNCPVAMVQCVLRAVAAYFTGKDCSRDDYIGAADGAVQAYASEAAEPRKDLAYILTAGMELAGDAVRAAAAPTDYSRHAEDGRKEKPRGRSGVPAFRLRHADEGHGPIKFLPMSMILTAAAVGCMVDGLRHLHRPARLEDADWFMLERDGTLSPLSWVQAPPSRFDSRPPLPWTGGFQRDDGGTHEIYRYTPGVVCALKPRTLYKPVVPDYSAAFEWEGA